MGSYILATPTVRELPVVVAAWYKLCVMMELANSTSKLIRNSFVTVILWMHDYYYYYYYYYYYVRLHHTLYHMIRYSADNSPLVVPDQMVYWFLYNQSQKKNTIIYRSRSHKEYDGILVLASSYSLHCYRWEKEIHLNGSRVLVLSLTCFPIIRSEPTLC